MVRGYDKMSLMDKSNQFCSVEPNPAFFESVDKPPLYASS